MSIWDSSATGWSLCVDSRWPSFRSLGMWIEGLPPPQEGGMSLPAVARLYIYTIYTKASIARGVFNIAKGVFDRCRRRGI